MRKMIRDPQGDALEGILGDAMPPDEALPYPDYVMLVRWIAGGAVE